MKKNVLQKVVKSLEAEIGKELDYAVFDTEEFKYRIDMYDKLVCDIIDLPHEKLIDDGSYPHIFPKSSKIKIVGSYQLIFVFLYTNISLFYII